MHHLVNDILNTPWMIDKQYALSMQNQIVRLIQGKTVSFNQTEPIAISYVGANSNSYSSEMNGSDEKTVAIVSIRGAITKADQYCGPKGTMSINKQIKALGKNPQVAAIVIDMDTPGGQASFLDTLSKTIKSTKKKKPVLTYYSGLCASAGYYIASSCTEIYAAEQTDVVGSIGTMVTFFDFSEQLKAKGIKLHEVYATQSTNKNKMFANAINGDYKLLKEQMLDPFAQNFIDTVKANRSIKNEEVFTGNTYMSTKAIEYNLIDGVKSFEEVIDRAFELSKSTKPNNNNHQVQTNPKNMKKGIQTVADLLGFDTLEAHEGQMSFSTENVEKIGEALATMKPVDEPKSKSSSNEKNPEIEALEKRIDGLNNSVEGINKGMGEIKTLLGVKPVTEPENTNASTTELDDENKKVESWNNPDDQFNAQLK